MKKEDDGHDQEDCGSHGELDVVDRFPDELRLVIEEFQVHGAGHGGPQAREFCLDFFGHERGVGPDLFAHAHDQARVPFAVLEIGPPGPVVLYPVDRSPKILYPQGIAVLVGDDERVELPGAAQLAVGVQGVGGPGAVEGSHGHVHVAFLERLGHLVDADAAVGEALGVDLDPDGVPLGRDRVHEGHAIDGGEIAR